MNSYEQKQEAKRERILARADRLRAEGSAKIKSGMDRLKAIPFGQPILVGHYSEKGDRSYRRKAVGAVDKGCELLKAADHAAARAASIGTGGISSDDPEAVQKLDAELSELKAKQQKMAEANKLVRKKDIAGLVALGIPQSLAVKACTVPVWGNKFCAFEPYQLSNNSANIRRIEQRIESLKAAAGRETKEEDYQGVCKLIENAEANRVQIVFPGKPSAEIRTKLKKAGFRWSPTEGAWQRQLNNSAVYWARELVKELAGQ